MSITFWSVGLSLANFGILLLMIELGRRWGLARMRVDPERGLSGMGAIEGSVLGLYGLLIAFSFGGAMQRFNERTDQIIEDVGVIDSARLRLEYLPEADRAAIRKVFVQYLDERLKSYQVSGSGEATRQSESLHLKQNELWSMVLAVYRRDGFSSTGNAVLSAFNDLFEMGERRLNTRMKHTPVAIFILLYTLGWIAAMMAGMALAETKSRNWLYEIGLALINTVAIYYIMDIEYPRHGLIKIDSVDEIIRMAVDRCR